MCGSAVFRDAVHAVHLQHPRSTTLIELEYQPRYAVPTDKGVEEQGLPPFRSLGTRSLSDRPRVAAYDSHHRREAVLNPYSSPQFADIPRDNSSREYEVWRSPPSRTACLNSGLRETSLRAHVVPGEGRSVTTRNVQRTAYREEFELRSIR